MALEAARRPATRGSGGDTVVRGDNRYKSYDSRFWGSLDVKGKAVVIYGSWDSSAGKIRWERIGKPVN
jgi:hypothetical protein